MRQHIHLLIIGCLLIGACSARDRSSTTPAPVERASYEVRNQRGRDDVLVILALSGGGSRAAYFSGATMLQLAKVFPNVDILKEVDVLSSVSGGSLAAAYYSISRDPDRSVSVRVSATPIPPFPTPPAPGAEAKDEATPRMQYNEERELLTTFGPLSDVDMQQLQAAFPNSLDKLQQLKDQSDALNQHDRVWDDATVKKLMGRNYLLRWLGRWFYPQNALRYWFTSFTRTDIMSSVFADSLFDSNWYGRDLTYADLNPERPDLIVNATDATEPQEKAIEGYGALQSSSVTRPAHAAFTFTTEDFKGVLGRSDLGDFAVSDAVMASAAFPAVFNYVNLKRGPSQDGYAHLFDGGNHDNLGLTSVDTVLSAHVRPYSETPIIVLLVDSFVPPRGIDSQTRDPRGLLDRIIDTNFIDTFDALLSSNRKNLLNWFSWRYGVERNNPKNQVWFCHVSFEGISDATKRAAANAVPTSFSLSPEDACSINKAVKALITEDDACLQGVRDILLRKTPERETSNRVGRDPRHAP